MLHCEATIKTSCLGTRKRASLDTDYSKTFSLDSPVSRILTNKLLLFVLHAVPHTSPDDQLVRLITGLVAQLIKDSAPAQSK